MNGDQLQAAENEGRRFATALADAGFGRQMIGDASTAPYCRIRVEDHMCSETAAFTVQQMLAPAVKPADHFRKGRTRSGAFVAGVLAVLEERGL